MSTDLALRTTVRELVAAFVSAERDVRQAFGMLAAAEKSLNDTFAIGETHRPFHVSACGDTYRDNFKDADQAVAILTRQAWSTIVDRLELRRFMSIARYEELQKQLSGREHVKLPAITEESVMRFAHDHLSQARTMLQEAVREVWEWLRPRKGSRVGDLKTNTEMEVGERVILGYMVESGFGGRFRINYSRRQNLVALENVFNGLAGNGEIAPAWQSAIETALEASPSGEGKTALFAFRGCKNGNLHLQCLRLDLLAKFNALAAGKVLRPVETEGERLKREVMAARAENERLRREAARKAAA